MQAPKTLQPGKAPARTMEDLSAAYLEAVINSAETLRAIDASLGVIALYCERKGLAEKLFTEEDLDGGD